MALQRTDAVKYILQRVAEKLFSWSWRRLAPFLESSQIPNSETGPRKQVDPPQPLGAASSRHSQECNAKRRMRKVYNNNLFDLGSERNRKMPGSSLRNPLVRAPSGVPKNSRVEGQSAGGSAGCRKTLFHDVGGDRQVSPAGRSPKGFEAGKQGASGASSHLFGLSEGLPNLAHGFAGRPDHHNLIHGATMQPCRTDRTGSDLTCPAIRGEPRPRSSSAS